MSTKRNALVRFTRPGWLGESVTAFLAGAAGRSAGFVLTLLIARRLGATSDTDAFYLALSVTVYLSEIVRMSIEGAFVPAFVAARASGPRDADDFFAGTATLFGAVGIGAAFVIAAAAVMTARGGGCGPFSVASLHYLAWLALFLVPTLVTTAASMVLYALHAFVVPALSPLVQALCVLTVLLLWGSNLGAGALVAGYLVGAILQLVVLLLVLRRYGVTLRLVWPSERVVAAYRAAIPIAVGGVLANANAVADKVVAGWLLAPGSISMLENAGRVFAILMFLSYGALANVVTIRWSELATAGAPGALARAFVRTMRPATLLVTLASLALAWQSRPVVTLLFAHGTYAADAVAPTAAALAMLAAALPLFFVTGMSSRFLYAIGDTSVFAKGAALTFCVNLPADIVLGHWFGIAGIAGATAVTYLFAAGYFLRRVRRHFPTRGLVA